MEGISINIDNYNKAVKKVNSACKRLYASNNKIEFIPKKCNIRYLDNYSETVYNIKLALEMYNSLIEKDIDNFNNISRLLKEADENIKNNIKR